MVNNSRSQGFAHAFLVIGLVAALLGALGFIFWQNFIHKEPTVTKTQTVTKPQPKEEVESNKGYLVLKDWGIKFKIPETKSEIVYYKVQIDDGFFYDFTTKRVEALGENCVDGNSPGGATRLGAVGRSTTKKTDNIGSRPFNRNNEAMGDGYYYYLSYTSALCADTSGDIQGEDRAVIVNMLDSLSLVKEYPN